jgi:hypothetical protein
VLEPDKPGYWRSLGVGNHPPEGFGCPFLGIVYALGEKAALKQAITEFAIRPEDEWRLLTRRSGAWRAE